MEKVDLGSVVSAPHSRWSEYDEDDRSKRLKEFPFSVLVATSFVEIDFVNGYMKNKIGPREALWDQIFYYKLDYDFGYAEYFFRDEGVLESFQMEIPKFFGVFPSGAKIRTNRRGEYFNVD